VKGEKERSDSEVDGLILEYLSLSVYRKGKRPFLGIDPLRRIRKGIWREEGVDLTMLARNEGSGPEKAARIGLFEKAGLEVKEGLFRKRVQHRIITGIRDPEKAIEDLERDIDKGENTASPDALLRSDILFPVLITNMLNDQYDALSELSVKRNTQYALNQPSQASARVSLLGEEEGRSEEGGIGSLFDRKVGKEEWIRAGGRTVAVDLPTMIRAVFEIGDGELSGLISSGRLATFCRRGLNSGVLAAVVDDMGKAPDGGPEGPQEFRKRFGRWLMGSELADRVQSDLIDHDLSLLISTNTHGAKRIERALSYLMGPKSIPALKELLFSVPPKNRPAVISLLGMTGDSGAVEPLRKMLRYSTDERDREGAAEALSGLGEELP